MRYQILKQYIPGNNSIWVGAISTEDSIEIFDTLQEAENRMQELIFLNPGREFKIVETE